MNAPDYIYVKAVSLLGASDDHFIPVSEMLTTSDNVLLGPWNTHDNAKLVAAVWAAEQSKALGMAIKLNNVANEKLSETCLKKLHDYFTTAITALEGDKGVSAKDLMAARFEAAMETAKCCGPNNTDNDAACAPFSIVDNFVVGLIRTKTISCVNG
ncbi:MAG: hypothetical protein AB7G06_07710 [Bdellovibrionales bacterium]